MLKNKKQKNNEDEGHNEPDPDHEDVYGRHITCVFQFASIFFW